MSCAEVKLFPFCCPSVEAPDDQKLFVKRLRKLAYQVNNQVATQEAGRAARFHNVKVIDSSVVPGQDTIVLGSVVATVWEVRPTTSSRL